MAKGLTKEQGEELRKSRMSICADILQDMDREPEPDLPLPNVRRLAQIMVERFETGDYIAELEDSGKHWHLTEVYVLNNIQDICTELAVRGRPFAYYREWKEFKGVWKFCSKSEYKTVLARDHSDVATRTDTHNQKLDEVSDKWDLQLPHIREVPLLTN